MYTEPSHAAFDEPPLANSAHQKTAALAGPIGHSAASSKRTTRGTTIAAAGSNSTEKRNRARRTSSHTFCPRISKAGANWKAAPCSATHSSLPQRWHNSFCTARRDSEISRQCQRRRRTRRSEAGGVRGGREKWVPMMTGLSSARLAVEAPEGMSRRLLLFPSKCTNIPATPAARRVSSGVGGGPPISSTASSSCGHRALTAACPRGSAAAPSAPSCSLAPSV